MLSASSAGANALAQHPHAGSPAGIPDVLAAGACIAGFRTPHLKRLIPAGDAELADTSYDGRWRILKMLRQRRDALAALRRSGSPHYDAAAFQDICQAVNAEREALEAAFPEGLA
jgi:hypothetical protein